MHTISQIHNFFVFLFFFLHTEISIYDKDVNIMTHIKVRPVMLK